ncbi:MAG TPA: MFS transporter, partial [Roseomonas sp.]
YQEAKAEKAPTRTGEAGNWTLAGRAFGFTILWTVSYYVMLNYMPTFTQAHAGLSRSEALWSNTIGLLVLVVTVPLMGMISDRIGRKPLLLACCLAFVVLTYPLFLLLLSGGLGTVILVQIVFALMIAAFSGPGPAAISEIFPTASRSTYMSTGYSLAVAVFGGFAPYIATWLIATTGSPLSPTFYLIASAILSTLVILRLRETAHSDLR